MVFSWIPGFGVLLADRLPGFLTLDERKLLFTLVILIATEKCMAELVAVQFVLAML